MGLNEQSWKPGQRPEGEGRPVGAGNRASQQNRDYYKEMKYKDLIELWGETASNEKLSMEVRLQAARDAAPYLYNKLGAKPIPADPVYIDHEVHLPCPEPTTVVQVNSNIWYLHQLKITGQLPIDRADNLINDQRILGNNIIDHDKLIAAQGDPSQPQQIIITGGLPQLPGTNITMPEQLNGHHLELSANKDPINGDPQPHPDEESKP
jgi:hypothetical protein